MLVTAPGGRDCSCILPYINPHLYPHQTAENGGSLGSMFQRGQQLQS